MLNLPNPLKGESWKKKLALLNSERGLGKLLIQALTDP